MQLLVSNTAGAFSKLKKTSLRARFYGAYRGGQRKNKRHFLQLGKKGKLTAVLKDRFCFCEAVTPQ